MPDIPQARVRALEARTLAPDRAVSHAVAAVIVSIPIALGAICASRLHDAST